MMIYCSGAVLIGRECRLDTVMWTAKDVNFARPLRSNEGKQRAKDAM